MGDSAGGIKPTYAQAMVKQDSSSFKMPMRYPVDINGESGFIFTNLEMSKAADDFRFALVLKFVRIHPPIEKIRRHIIKSWGLLESPTISFMDAYYVLLRLQTERDFVHAWAREGRLMEGCVFRIFKWTKDFDLHIEPSLAPQWIFLPGLPMHLYRQDCLQILATRFGRYLGTNHATLNQTRATGACMCVEIDLKEDLVQGFPIVVSVNKTLWQAVKYEKLGFYCTKCCRQGHTVAVCRIGEYRKNSSRERITVSCQDWKKVTKENELQMDISILKEIPQSTTDCKDNDEGKQVLNDLTIIELKEGEFTTNDGQSMEILQLENMTVKVLPDCSGLEDVGTLVCEDVMAEEILKTVGSNFSKGLSVIQDGGGSVVLTQDEMQVVDWDTLVEMSGKKDSKQGHMALVSELLELECQANSTTAEISLPGEGMTESFSDGETRCKSPTLMKERCYDSDTDLQVALKVSGKKQAVRQSLRVLSRPSKLNL
ncbi:uncharacterized protein LOC118344704 [Juglans regia]|uniref:Uncharacterized protein LOC118344704 n=1 Tax=Juglans regia TaxID=51240 RepID=A0A6P9EFV6_JUGRE|nr:uncharacterized protein LOC118344704 [Juglans regia]